MKSCLSTLCIQNLASRHAHSHAVGSSAFNFNPRKEKRMRIEEGLLRRECDVVCEDECHSAPYDILAYLLSLHESDNVGLLKVAKDKDQLQTTI